jgi:hypothetical protein
LVDRLANAMSRLFKVGYFERVGNFTQARVKESPGFVAVLKSSLRHKLCGRKTNIELSA